MNRLTHRLLLAALIATSGTIALAQNAPPERGDRPERMDPAKMAEFHAKRMADLKAALKITPAQEGAWSQYHTAMQPPANRGQQDDAAREARRKAHGDATKAFYAQLTPAQQKTFDEQRERRGPRGDGPGRGPGGGTR